MSAIDNLRAANQVLLFDESYICRTCTAVVEGRHVRRGPCPACVERIGIMRGQMLNNFVARIEALDEPVSMFAHFKLPTKAELEGLTDEALRHVFRRMHWQETTLYTVRKLLADEMKGRKLS